MGEAPRSILGIGCPSSDIARQLDRSLDSDLVNGIGSGSFIDVNQPFLIVIFHPTTTRYGAEQGQMRALLEALQQIRMQTILLWPNIDVGADHISKAIRVFRDRVAPNWLRTITNLLPEDYLKVLSHAACAVGNSSSFIRDAGYFGTPVVLIGDRQDGRETDAHVHFIPCARNEIVAAVRAHLAHGRYAPSALYGDGFVSQRIAEAVARLTPYVQKRLNYVYEGSDAALWGAASVEIERVNGGQRALRAGKPA
jgi:UDP-N-acetylglucosamine 2-epimerase